MPRRQHPLRRTTGAGLIDHAADGAIRCLARGPETTRAGDTVGNSETHAAPTHSLLLAQVSSKGPLGAAMAALTALTALPPAPASSSPEAFDSVRTTPPRDNPVLSSDEASAGDPVPRICPMRGIGASRVRVTVGTRALTGGDA